MKQLMKKEKTVLREADKEKPEKREGGAAAGPEKRAIHSGIPRAVSWMNAGLSKATIIFLHYCLRFYSIQIDLEAY